MQGVGGCELSSCIDSWKAEDTMVVPACRKDRITVQEREAEALRQKELEQEAKRMAEERRKYTLKVPRGRKGSHWVWGSHHRQLSWVSAADCRGGSKEGV